MDVITKHQSREEATLNKSTSINILCVTFKCCFLFLIYCLKRACSVKMNIKPIVCVPLFTLKYTYREEGLSVSGVATTVV